MPHKHEQQPDSGKGKGKLNGVPPTPDEVHKMTQALLESDNWRDLLKRSEKGKILGTVENVLIALRFSPQWRGVLAWDEWSQEMMILAPTPWADPQVPRPWRDTEETVLLEWLQQQGIPATNLDAAYSCARRIAFENSFHPIRNYLELLNWDGVKRLDEWVITYLGCGPSDLDDGEEAEGRLRYLRAVGAKWMIGAVARIFQPGCKMDSCLILEGPQNIGKSTALRILGSPWFTDAMPSLNDMQEAAIQIKGHWIIEFSELNSMYRSETSATKAFISRNEDHYRPKFGRSTVKIPRRCVFAGTVNHTQYLKDETGGRRFWPIACTKVDIDALARDRDQLWAEARERYFAGEPWHITDESLLDLTEAEQIDRFEGSETENFLREWLPGKLQVSISEYFELKLNRLKGQWTKSEEIEVGRSMRALGWKSIRSGLPGRPRRWIPGFKAQVK